MALSATLEATGFLPRSLDCAELPSFAVPTEAAVVFAAGAARAEGTCALDVGFDDAGALPVGALAAAGACDFGAEMRSDFGGGAPFLAFVISSRLAVNFSNLILSKVAAAAALPPAAAAGGLKMDRAKSDWRPPDK